MALSRTRLSWLLCCALACGGPSTTESADSQTNEASGTESSPALPGVAPAASACAEAEVRRGEATYYREADGTGNCSFAATPGDLLVAAINTADYQGSAACGACVRVEGPAGTVDVRVVDRCPGCAAGDLDLSPQAFENIAALEAGRVAISWSTIECPVEGHVAYHFKDGSNPFWTGVQVRNHAHPIATLEYKKDSSWVAVKRLNYNYFVETNGMGDGPYSMRITDIHGHTLEDDNIPLLDDASAPGNAQFPSCE